MCPIIADGLHRYYWHHGVSYKGVESEADLTIDRLARDRLILGDPEECIQEFHRWNQATGADYFLLRLRQAHSGGPPHERIADTLRLFGEKVIPYCR